MSHGRLLITDTTLRDAHQSLIATRLKTEDMLPLAQTLDRAGFFSVEAWGGATFDSSIRFLAEDPWDRVRLLKEALTHTSIQMLLRGQNLVGYRHYPDDVVDKFVECAFNVGVDIFRVFDALNDIRNMKESMRMVKEVGAHLQGAICYTTSPVNSIPGFIDMVRELYAYECDSICIKDMAGLIMPDAARELITGIKDEMDVLVDLHSHATSGIAPMSYQAAAEAGVDIIMLDNMSLEMMRQAVKEIQGRAKTEASGNINLNNVRAVAQTGVDFISIGALTHSVKAMDISLEFNGSTINGVK